eukprot:GFYU01001540.1.p1 GENE.GFYU01001540.1~~GFYU01001540.1.p1  ORF type:complete len:390 (+),score=39.61 GFYU01001540.1:175-1344(+)
MKKRWGNKDKVQGRDKDADSQGASGAAADGTFAAKSQVQQAESKGYEAQAVQDSYLGDLIRSIDYFHSPIEEAEIQFELVLLLFLVTYLLIQNFIIYSSNFYNYNLYLLFLTVIYLSKRVIYKYYCLLRTEYPLGISTSQTCLNIVLLLFLIANGGYLVLQIVLRNGLVTALHLVYPCIAYGLFIFPESQAQPPSIQYRLKMLLWNTFDCAYWAGVLPMQFLQYEYLYFDSSRCLIMIAFVATNSFVMFATQFLANRQLSFEIQSAYAFWREIASDEEVLSQSATKWSSSVVYEHGAVVTHNGVSYRGVGAANRVEPHSTILGRVVMHLCSTERVDSLRRYLLLLQSMVTGVLFLLVLYSPYWCLYSLLMLFNYYLIYLCLILRHEQTL